MSINSVPSASRLRLAQMSALRFAHAADQR